MQKSRSWNETIIKLDKQFIHMNFTIEGDLSLLITFVYGFHTPIERKELWLSITSISPATYERNWMIIGDFNEVTLEGEHMGQGTYMDSLPDDFKAMILVVGLPEMEVKGGFFTWNHSQIGDKRYGISIN